MRKYNFPFNKIASAMAINNSFVKLVASEGKPTFASTGMTNIEEIDKDLSEGNQLQFDFFNNYPPRDMSDDVSKLFSQHFLKAKKEVQEKS